MPNLFRALLAAFLLVFAASLSAQPISFDFDSAPMHASLPVGVTVSNLTAHLAATGQGFSIQEAGVMGFTPAGFSGLCIYPNSVYAADLILTFSYPLTSLSIMYAPEEYACDSSARMRITGYAQATLVATATTTTYAGTWPTGTLTLTTVQPFDHVVIHYDAPPPTGGDWGPIFMADNMSVTLAPPAIGDADGNGFVNVGDVFYLVNWLFAGGPACVGAADANADGIVDVADVFYLINYLFAGGPAPHLPAP